MLEKLLFYFMKWNFECKKGISIYNIVDKYKCIKLNYGFYNEYIFYRIIKLFVLRKLNVYVC